VDLRLGQPLEKMKLQLANHQMTCTERRCLFFHAILFFSLVEGTFCPSSQEQCPTYFPIDPECQRGPEVEHLATAWRVILNRYILPQALPFPELLPVFPPAWYKTRNRHDRERFS